jgi:hypothetical protein
VEAEISASGGTKPQQRTDCDNRGHNDDGRPRPTSPPRPKACGRLRLFIPAWLADLGPPSMALPRAQVRHGSWPAARKVVGRIDWTQDIPFRSASQRAHGRVRRPRD